MDLQYSYRLSKLVNDLKFDIIYPSMDYEKVEIFSGDVHRPGLQLAGFFDYFDPTRLQLLGQMEVSYLTALTEEEQNAKIDRLMSQKIPAVIICHKAELLDGLLAAAEKYDVTILRSEENTSDVMSSLIRTIKAEIAPRITRHGVLVEVYGIGVLILGESGVGKSETAIELLKRGHRLIADDAVEIKAIDNNVLQGTAPALIRHYMELRGIGIVDVRQIFGVGAVKWYQNIHLIVKMEPWEDGMLYDRLGIEDMKTELLGVEVSTLTIPVKPGRNLAVILEVAAMNQRMKVMGYNAAVEFTKQLNSMIDQQI